MDFGRSRPLTTSIAYNRLARKMAPQTTLETKMHRRFMIGASHKSSGAPTPIRRLVWPATL